MDRERALDLLNDQHTFPGTFSFRVIVDAEVRAGVIAVVQAALSAEERLADVREKPSRAGRWMSLKLVAEVQSAETVLDLYALLDEVEGVRMTL